MNLLILKITIAYLNSKIGFDNSFIMLSLNSSNAIVR